MARKIGSAAPHHRKGEGQTIETPSSVVAGVALVLAAPVPRSRTAAGRQRRQDLQLFHTGNAPRTLLLSRTMKWAFALALLLWTACTPIRQIAPPSGGAVERGHGWQRITDPSTLGYSRTGLDSALAIVQGMNTSALLVTVGGRSLLEYGDLSDTSYVASARKSILSMLYGKYVENGTIRLNETLAGIGIDDLGGLLPLERTATVEHLLGAALRRVSRGVEPGRCSRHGTGSRLAKARDV